MLQQSSSLHREHHVQASPLRTEVMVWNRKEMLSRQLHRLAAMCNEKSVPQRMTGESHFRSTQIHAGDLQQGMVCSPKQGRVLRRAQQLGEVQQSPEKGSWSGRMI